MPTDMASGTEASAGGISVLRERVRAILRIQGVRFILVGGVNSVFAFVLFAALQATLGQVVHYLVVLVLAQVVGILEAYVLQRWLVFQARGRWWRDLVRFASVYAVSFCVNAVMLPALVELAHVPVVPAQAIVMVVVACGTFVVHQRFTFRHSSGHRAQAQAADPGAQSPNV